MAAAQRGSEPGRGFHGTKEHEWATFSASISPLVRPQKRQCRRELIKELIGAKGIGTHYLCEEVAPEVDPLSPGNKLIFVVGPMGGTAMLGSNRYALYFASPLTGGYGECYSGGNLTPQFARTGYKVVIVEGKADGPVYLEISEEGAALHDASDLWGMDAFKAEDEILARTPHKKAQACVIGPAGEKLVQVRLRQQQLLAPARPWRPGRGVRLQEPQGHRLARREEGRRRASRRLQGRRSRPHRAHQGRRAASRRTSAAAHSTWCAS